LGETPLGDNMMIANLFLLVLPLTLTKLINALCKYNISIRDSDNAISDIEGDSLQSSQHYVESAYPILAAEGARSVLYGRKPGICGLWNHLAFCERGHTWDKFCSCRLHYSERVALLSALLPVEREKQTYP